MTDRTGYKGRASASELVARELAVMAAQMPPGTPVVHRGGRTGTVTLDEPRNVPGIHTGRPTAFCFTDVNTGAVKVCVRWNNTDGIPWIAWVPLDDVHRSRGTRLNKPVLAVKGR